MGGFIVSLGGQNITDWVDPLSLSIESALGQGPGVVGNTSGRATTASFITSLGPAGAAKGAGAALPTRNLLSANQSNVETDLTGLVGIGNGSTVSRDTSTAWQGSASIKVVTDGTVAAQGVFASLPSTEFIPGASYTVSAYVKGPASATINVSLYQGTPAQTIGTFVTLTCDGTWQRVTQTATAPTVLPSGSIGINVRTNGTQAITFNVDGLQVETGTTATAWVQGGTLPTLLRQAELVIYDTTTGNRMFGGYVSKLSDLTMRVQPKVQVDCHDYWQDLDRVQCNLVYDGVADTAIINDVITNHANWIDLSLVNLTVSNYTFQLRRFRAKSVQQILQTVADVVGFDVWVDANKKLHYQSPSSLGTAAFAISDQPDGSSSFGAVFSKYEVDDNAIVNRAYFYGGKKASADFTQDLSNQATGSNTLFTVAYYPRNASDGKVHIKKNGTDLVVGAAFGSGAANTLKSQGGSADVILNVDAQTIQFDVAPLAADSITALYRYDIPLLVQLTNQQSQSFYGRWYDGNIVDPGVFDTQTAIQRLRLLLVEQSYGLVEIAFTTRQPGLVAGTQISITNQARGIAGTYMIQKVTTHPLGGGYYDFEVECGAWNWQLADLLLAAAKFLTPQDDSTDENTTPIQAQEVTTNLGVHTTVTATVTGSGTYVYGTGKYGFATYA